MTNSSYGSETLIKAMRAAAEGILAVLDESEGFAPTRNLPRTSAPTDRDEATAGEPTEYDPLYDTPPFTPNPQKGAPLAQQQLAWITYLGSIGRINAEQNRGAESKEITEFAAKAGYKNGAAVNGWNSREGSPRAVEVVDGARFLNSDALGWIQKDAAKLGIKLVGEIVTVPASR